MTIEIGDRIPEVVLQRIGDSGIEQIDTGNLFDGRRIVLFGVPGAFTPTCSEKHLPGYIEHFSAFQDRGVQVACLSVNDPFVMQAWGKASGAPSGLMMLADGNAALTKALGVEMDASAFGMGQRCKRFALFADDGVVQTIAVEDPGELRVSTAEAMLQHVA